MASACRWWRCRGRPCSVPRRVSTTSVRGPSATTSTSCRCLCDLVTRRRIGIDVGGTNTDAVLVEDDRVLHAVKTPTTEDVTGGIVTALRHLLAAVPDGGRAIDAVMIGTTHFTNAVVQRRDLARVA